MTSSQALSSQQRDQLLEAARKVALNAYILKTSNFRVGAALLTAERRIYSGCNVENSSYGLTNCAERTAIFAAVADSGPKLKIVAIAVVGIQGDDEVACAPCGACRQVIYEFGQDAIVIFQSETQGWTDRPIRDLLPEGFVLK